MDTLTTILKLPLIGILRGFEPKLLPAIIEAVLQGGLRSIEITMNSPDAGEQIRRAKEIGGQSLNVGAGTVTRLALLKEALGAGATFIVTPSLNRPVLAECVRLKVPIFPGAFSPTEIYEAWEMGASMVKLFPADAVGPAYVRALRGPFPKIKLLPTGGVDLKTAGEFLRAGAAGLGVGGPLFDKEQIEAANWQWLREQTAKFVSLLEAN